MNRYLKNRLLNNLHNETYCRLKPSQYSGIGVFAIKDIPTGVNPFKKAFYKKQPTVNLTETEVKKLPEGVQRMIYDFFQKDENKVFSIPKYGLNDLDVTFYLNHSDAPNVDIVDDGKSEYLEFITNKWIHKDEELSINYEKYKEFD